MSTPDSDHDHDEAQLLELFDATAMEGSPEQLQRMARSAAGIPEHNAPASWWEVLFSGKARSIAVATAGAAALAALYVGGRDVTESVGESTPVVVSGDAATTSAPPAMTGDDDDSAIAALLDDGDDDAAVEDDLALAFDLAPADTTPFAALDLLFAPGNAQDDETLIDAYEEALEEDG